MQDDHIKDFWISPNGETVAVSGGSHHDTAGEILMLNINDLSPTTNPTEALMARGWIRVVACRISNNIFFERRGSPTEKHLAELKNLAIEHRCRLQDGIHMFYDPEGIVVPL